MVEGDQGNPQPTDPTKKGKGRSKDSSADEVKAVDTKPDVDGSGSTEVGRGSDDDPQAASQDHDDSKDQPPASPTPATSTKKAEFTSRTTAGMSGIMRRVRRRRR